MTGVVFLYSVLKPAFAAVEGEEAHLLKYRTFEVHTPTTYYTSNLDCLQEATQNFCLWSCFYLDCFMFFYLVVIPQIVVV